MKGSCKHVSCPAVRDSMFRIWATDPVVELPVKMGQEGVSATPPSTVYEVFQTTVENHGEEPALKYQHATEVIF